MCIALPLSPCIGQWMSEENLRPINQKFNALPPQPQRTTVKSQPPFTTFGLPAPISFAEIAASTADLNVSPATLPPGTDCVG